MMTLKILTIVATGMLLGCSGPSSTTEAIRLFIDNCKEDPVATFYVSSWFSSLEITCTQK